MVIFDANILISYVTEEDSANFRKLDFLIKDLADRKVTIGIPAPAWAEFLAHTNSATAKIIEKISGKRAIQILPFGEAEAIETAEIGKRIPKRKKKGEIQDPWQQVKYDRQILATTITRNAEILYTDDKHMIREAKILGINTCQTDDLSLPPESPQHELAFDVPRIS